MPRVWLVLTVKGSPAQAVEGLAGTDCGGFTVPVLAVEGSLVPAVEGLPGTDYRGVSWY